MAFVTGSISAVLYERGFGFIACADGVSRFFHRSAVKGCPFTTLTKDMPVVCEPMDTGGKGPRAILVRPRHGATVFAPERAQ